MRATEQIPVLLIPGVAADQRIFRAQRQEFSQLCVPARIEANSVNPDIASYARQCADEWVFGKQACLSVDRPYFLGGMSVGGIIAIELAWHLHALGKAPQGVLLLSSCRSWDAIPSWYSRWYQWSESLPRWFASKLFYNRQVTHAARSEQVGPQTTQLIASMFRGTDGDQLRSSVRMLTTWRRDAVDIARAPFPVYQLHGRLDGLMTPPSAKDATLLLDAGHWMCATHATAVNNWITAILDDTNLRWHRPGSRK